MFRLKHTLLNLFFILIINLLFCAYPPGILAGDTIRINGSGTCLEMIKPLMEAYGKNTRGVSFQVEKSWGSSGAIKALLAGAIDIAIVARPLKPEEIARGGKLENYGKTPLVVITEKKVSAKNISTRELEDIYSGKTMKWPNGETIRVILRPNEETDMKILKGLSPGMAGAVAQAHDRRGMLIAMTDSESIMAVSRTTGGIGTATLTHVLIGKLPLNILALNGVNPSRENLANGTYPLSKDINFVTTGKLSHAAAKFLKFIYSNKGCSIAEKNGVLIAMENK